MPEGSGFGGVSIGAVARNLFGSVTYQSGHTDPFDRVFVIGMSMKPIDKLILAADFDITNTTGHLGAEYLITPQVALRAGGILGGDGLRLTAGAGFLQNLRIDYAYQTHSTT